MPIKKSNIAQGDLEKLVRTENNGTIGGKFWVTRNAEQIVGVFGVKHRIGVPDERSNGACRPRALPHSTKAFGLQGVPMKKVEDYCAHADECRAMADRARSPEDNETSKLPREPKHPTRAWRNPFGIGQLATS
jgi:hypothetical protein